MPLSSDGSLTLWLHKRDQQLSEQSKRPFQASFLKSCLQPAKAKMSTENYWQKLFGKFISEVTVNDRTIDSPWVKKDVSNSA
jgi:hypothetical protein